MLCASMEEELSQTLTLPRICLLCAKKETVIVIDTSVLDDVMPCARNNGREVVL